MIGRRRSFENTVYARCTYARKAPFACYKCPIKVQLVNCPSLERETSSAPYQKYPSTGLTDSVATSAILDKRMAQKAKKRPNYVGPDTVLGH